MFTDETGVKTPALGQEGFPFAAYSALLERCLARRQEMVEDLAHQLFGARGKAAARRDDRQSIAAALRTCILESPTLAEHQPSLSRQLEAAHRADGFEPAGQDGYARGLDPVELVLRACHHWDTTRWPGASARLVYAHSLFVVLILGELERLSLRIWDHGFDQATPRLHQLQHLLDLLHAGGPSSRQMLLVRDARWLIQTAQGPLTRHLRPYFVVAAKVSRLADDVRLEIHKAGAALAGGHLRSQFRHFAERTRWAYGDPQLLALTRISNSMDLALLVGDLVPLLDAYRAACVRQDRQARLALADAILQGLSADPELLLVRLDVLEASTVIPDLFLDHSHAGGASPTALGEVHRTRLARYGELVGCTAESLLQDSHEFDPGQMAYSPLGLVYGFCADLFLNMILGTLGAPGSPEVTLDDLFNSRERLEEKRARAEDWGRLPKGPGERDPFEYSAEWATRMYGGFVRALEARAARPVEPNASAFRKAGLYVVPRGVSIDSIPEGMLSAGMVSAQEHCLTSDVARARLTGATALSADRLADDRAEGRLLACEQSEGVWFGVSKAPLTTCTCLGNDALITDVPAGVVDVLRRVCPELLVVIGHGHKDDEHADASTLPDGTSDRA